MKSAATCCQRHRRAALTSEGKILNSSSEHVQELSTAPYQREVTRWLECEAGIRHRSEVSRSAAAAVFVVPDVPFLFPSSGDGIMFQDLLSLHQLFHSCASSCPVSRISFPFTVSKEPRCEGRLSGRGGNKQSNSSSSISQTYIVIIREKLDFKLNSISKHSAHSQKKPTTKGAGMVGTSGVQTEEIWSDFFSLGRCDSSECVTKKSLDWL